jgi:hypothetical protein
MKKSQKVVYSATTPKKANAMAGTVAVSALVCSAAAFLSRQATPPAPPKW